jgi:hypothetical protein
MMCTSRVRPRNRAVGLWIGGLSLVAVLIAILAP